MSNTAMVDISWDLLRAIDKDVDVQDYGALAKTLHFPDGARITHCRTLYERELYRVTVSHPDLLARRGDEVPFAYPTYRRDGTLSFVGWGQSQDDPSPLTFVEEGS